MDWLSLFSDAFVAIAITLLALDLPVPGGAAGWRRKPPACTLATS
jgi:uncharacterized membrane protein